jgi:sn-glycerol 3-phosphate transport system permease protein
VEAARIDRAGPMRFFFDILLPLSRTNIAALFIILFIYGWNQYLWPFLITTDTGPLHHRHGHPADGERGRRPADLAPDIMGTAILAMIPPVMVVLACSGSS